MRWRNSKQSYNVEDRRGQEPMQAGMGGMGLLRILPFLLRTKIGRIILIAGAAFYAFQYFTGGNMLQNGMPNTSSQAVGEAGAEGQNDESRQFVAAILGTTETVWQQKLDGYQEPTLVLYNRMTQTGCGVGQAQTGPFYCPADQKIYLDLSFMNELKKLGAPGDFAFAYVIAHEVGHHVQKLQGTSDQVHQLQQQSSQADANKLSVMLELQADCYAGIWGHEVNQQMDMLEPGDIDEGIQAANAVGDDRLQQMAGQAVHPDAFTHGSSEQRIAWFKRGFESGDMSQCDTFSQLR
ncbi:KPN_02809 family neutral zinc metallopeptidase [Vibrio olivae]|uniref:Neutral zinc metallopeptidase n=1 Tax=Vibrio olivae TaxID=1243002 RepID=A0ABV5HTQ4_9VIBR